MAEILIIGGGVSGLSAGIYARLSGHRATVCERHSIAGGNLTGWDRGGYHIDNCIHWLTGTNPASSSYRMWEELGVLGNVEIMQGETLYTCEVEGKRLSLNKDLNRFEADMLCLSPEDEKEIRAFVSAVRVMQGLCGIAGEGHNERRLGLRLLSSLPAMMRYYQMTTGELGNRFRHPLLRFFFSAFCGEDFGAFSPVFVFAHFCGHNAGIPRGSSCAMAKRMTERFTALGGELLLKKEAVRINRKGKRAESVTFSDGTTLNADYVILTGDPAASFDKLLDVPMPKQLQKKYQNPQLKRFSSYQCAFSCDLETLPFCGDFIFEVPEEWREELGTRQLIVREFSHEKSFAPQGKNLLQTLIYSYEDKAKDFITLRQKDTEAYRKKKQALAERIGKLIEEQFSQTAGKLQCLDVWTPATYRRYTDTEIGSWMSFALPSKMLPFRVGNAVDGLSNVILATQWQQPPGGLPIAAEGGKIAIETVNKKEKRQH